MKFKGKMKKHKVGEKSWEPVKEWYDSLVGDDGHYYHKAVILPAIVKKIEESKARSVLDIACGQGVLARCLPKKIAYCGLDLSRSLIDAAKKRSQIENHTFLVRDARNFTEGPFDCAAAILAVQDIDDIDAVFASAFRSLKPGAPFYIVMNHPCFRIPRQTAWKVEQNLQYRTVSLYLSKVKIPIKTHPGKQEKSPTVLHHHRPMQAYVKALCKAGFTVEDFDEWISDKTSEGGAAKRENRARKEFPLFLCITARKRENG